MFLSSHLFRNSPLSPIILYQSDDYREPLAISDQGMPGTFKMADGIFRHLGMLIEENGRRDRP